MEPRGTTVRHARITFIKCFFGPPPAVPTLDKRSLPPPIRQAIVDLKAEYPTFTLHEIATICYAQFGRRPSPHTIQMILATGPKPSRTKRRYPLYAAFDDPVQGRLALIRHHFEMVFNAITGPWNIRALYTTLKRWIAEQFAGLADKSSRPHQPATKTTLRCHAGSEAIADQSRLGDTSVQPSNRGDQALPTSCLRILL